MSKLNLVGSAEEAENWIGFNRLVRPGLAKDVESQNGVSRKAFGQIFRGMIYLGVSVGVHL